MNDTDNIVLVHEIAALYGVSERVAQRRMQEEKTLLGATKATQEQLITLFGQGRIKGIPPQGVWIVQKDNVSRVTWRRTAGRHRKEKGGGPTS